MNQLPEYIKEAKNDFDLFYSNPEKYRENVINLSHRLGLAEDNKLQETFLPGYLAGNYQKEAKYIFIGINPGFDKDQNIIEEKLKDETWEKYHNFILNFFDIFASAGFKSPYFTRLYNLIVGLENDEDICQTRESKIKYMQGKILTMELIPYHSSRFNANLGDVFVNQYLKDRLNKCFDFIKTLKSQPRLVIFNGGPFKILLIDNKLWNNLPWQLIPFYWTTTSGLKRTLEIYIVEKDDLKCVIFSTFLMSARGLTNEHLLKGIPNLVKREFGGLK